MNLDPKDKIPFGKYKGYTIEDIIKSDPQYLYWVTENINWFALTTKSQEMLPDKKEIELYQKAKRACSDMRGLSRILSGGPSGEYAQLSMDSYRDDENDYEVHKCVS